MRQHTRVLATAISLVAVVALLAVAITARGVPPTAHATPANPPDEAAITYYFEVLNAGMLSGDFSALAEVYAPDAVLTQSNPKGVTVVAHGLTEITAWYQGFQAKFPGIQFTQESMRSLAPHVVLSYERAGGPTWVAPGRCMHVFALKGGKIVSTDWATFYGGQPA
jgi:hypothetical protein